MTQEKIVELRTRIAATDNPPDFIAICEAKPKNARRQLNLEEVQIDGYMVESENYLTEGGRGILDYVQKAISYHVIKPYTTFSEALSIEIILANELTMTLSCCYRSPNTSTTENDEKLVKFLKELEERQNTYTVIVGDFNLPKINWKDMTTPTPVNSKEFKFIEAVKDAFI
jgi:hypothetical protein